jgi:hypothetical protein
MINANDNSRFMTRITDFIARAYDWPIADTMDSAAVVRGVSVAPSRLARYAGYYEEAENRMVTFVPTDSGTGLVTLTDGLPDEVFLAIDSAQFGSAERQVWVTFTAGAGGGIDGLSWRSGDGDKGRMARIAPLPSSVTAMPDPDVALSGRIGAALQALRRGGDVLAAAPGLTSGAKHDFSRGVGITLAGAEKMAYVGEGNVAGRGLHRHGGDVTRVRYYRVTTAAGTRFILVYLTADGLVTDYDVVDQ